MSPVVSIFHLPTVFPSVLSISDSLECEMCGRLIHYKNEVTRITVAKKLCPYDFKTGDTLSPLAEDCFPV